MHISIAPKNVRVEVGAELIAGDIVTHVRLDVVHSIRQRISLQLQPALDILLTKSTSK